MLLDFSSIYPYSSFLHILYCPLFASFQILIENSSGFTLRLMVRLWVSYKVLASSPSPCQVLVLYLEAETPSVTKGLHTREADFKWARVKYSSFSD